MTFTDCPACGVIIRRFLAAQNLVEQSPTAQTPTSHPPPPHPPAAPAPAAQVAAAQAPSSTAAPFVEEIGLSTAGSEKHREPSATPPTFLPERAPALSPEAEAWPGSEVVAGSADGLVSWPAASGRESVEEPIGGDLYQPPSDEPVGVISESRDAPVTFDGARKMAFAIGTAVAVFLFIIPVFRFITRWASTAVHEVGHAATAWVFGYPSIPVIDFLGISGHGGFAPTWDRSLVLFLIVQAGFVVWAYRLRHWPRAIAIVAAIWVVHAGITWTGMDTVLQLLMGQGAELLVACYCYWRALASEDAVPAERPLCAGLGVFIQLEGLWLAHSLVTDEGFRGQYTQQGNDLGRVAETFGVDTATVALPFLLAAALPPIVAWLLWRNGARLSAALDQFVRG